MKSHHRIALYLTGLMAVAIAVDTIVRITTGDATVVTDDTSAGTAASVAMSLAIACAFGAGAVVVHRERSTFADTGKALRAFRMIAFVSLVGLVVGMGVLNPIQQIAGIESGPFYDVSGLLAALALLGTAVSAIALGLGSLRRPELGIGGRVLALVIPVVLVTIALGAVAPDVASPVFTTLTMMLGFGTVGAQPQRAAVPAVA